jgi:hypothetical protein
MRDDEDEPSCCYLLIIKFETEEEPLMARLKDHVPIILRVLKDISVPPSKPELAFRAKDGSAMGVAVRSTLKAVQIAARIHAGDGASPTPVAGQPAGTAPRTRLQS